MRLDIAATRSARLMALVAGLAFVIAAQAQTAGNTTGLNVTLSPLTGYATFVSTKEAATSLASRTGPAQDPKILLSQYGPLIGIENADTQLAQLSQYQDRLGHVHTAYAQVFNGVPVFGAEVRVHQKSGALVALNGNFFPITLALNTAPTITLDAAATIALASISASAPVVQQALLTIVDPGWYGNRRTGPRLAYYFTIAGTRDTLRQAVIVDAHNAAILDRWNLVESARNRRIYNAGSIYSLNPDLRFNAFVNIPAGPQVKLSRWEGRPPTGIKEVDRAYDYGGDTYDYFFRAFDRDGLDGKGGLIRSVVLHKMEIPCDNAFGGLDGNQQPMTDFCPGWTPDDILVHELTHTVTALTAKLVYRNQSGQLSESFSDVFGELVDLFNGNAAFAGPPNGPPVWPVPASYVGPGTDFIAGATPSAGNQKRHACSTAPAYTDGVRWLIGEDLRGQNVKGAIRDMWDPTCFQDPDHAQSTYYTCGGADDNGGVHSGSGVPNHAFALLTDGTKNFHGWEIQAIGPMKAGAVWYRALTTYLVPTSNFKDAYDALVRAADDLTWTLIDDPRTGTPADLFMAADAQQVDVALSAVGMATQVPCPWPPAPNAPTNLTAVLPASSTIVTLTWADNDTNLRSFRIEFKVGAAGTYATVAIVVPTARSFAVDIDHLFASSTVLFFRVIAIENDHGIESLPSNEASVTVP